MHHGRIARHGQDVALPGIHTRFFRKLNHKLPESLCRSLLKLTAPLRMILSIEDPSQNIVPVSDLRIEYTFRGKRLSGI